ncbi:thiamine phosphate synthase [Bifidobacterium sp. ESL0775]|uniref:thiamine phosphate synthase n=1 Tax=Bifidobacterium sp. ESL0775 TaxID=2983230 RepID=UPI0023F821F7|nr:thiamine phosphate synthase [Bifidobacterium sp. ESL0775]WEV69738.1 thiamine phosphate synthase [Bifidobacterium sp. ESL0775]
MTNTDNIPFASMRNRFDLSSYLVLGPADTKSRPVPDIVRQALAGGITFVQIRVKPGDARDITEIARQTAEVIAQAGASETVPLVIDDRADVAWQCRDMGIKIDGVHIGQDDMNPVEARKLLGRDAIIGLSCKVLDEVKATNALPVGTIDYIGAGPLHPSTTKPDCIVIGADHKRHTQDTESINALCTQSHYPIVVGGGVKLEDLPDLAQTKAAGWFVVSAIAGADDPQVTTKAMVDSWNAARAKRR